LCTLALRDAFIQTNTSSSIPKIIVTGTDSHGGLLVTTLRMPAFQTADILYVTPLVNC